MNQRDETGLRVPIEGTKTIGPRLVYLGEVFGLRVYEDPTMGPSEWRLVKMGRRDAGETHEVMF